MLTKKNPVRAAVLCLVIMAAVLMYLRPVRMAVASPSLLHQSIIDYNLKVYTDSLSDGSYDGAAGILLIRPEIAHSLGLKALINQDYIEARDLKAKGDRLFTQAISALTSQDGGAFSGENAKRAVESALASKEALASAQRHFSAYRSSLTPEADERLNKDACARLMESLLQEGLKQAAFNLRDGLGIFYNRCQGLPEDTPSLTPENVRFVNYVFSEFGQKGSETDQKVFDLEKQDPSRGRNPGSSWKIVVNRDAPHLLSAMESCLDGFRGAEYPADPLLFMALMRRESNFDSRAVSYVGAAGLTQIMPKTGEDLGMKTIYMPPYFGEATSLMKRERSLRQKAISLISNITPENMAEQAEAARGFMQESLDCGKKRSSLFARYRKELLAKKPDDRLDPRKAIAYGYRYFSDLMKMQNGDITLALAAYNAGPHRVTEYNGVPPYAETVTFRNTVLKYYREYLDRVKQTN